MITTIIRGAVLKIMSELEETGTLSYTSVEKVIQQTICKAVVEWEDEEDDLYDTDNGPTGHGDMCWSDADPGL